jgi:pimeloyl-ACP methyl ester carboxylesterase
MDSLTTSVTDGVRFYDGGWQSDVSEVVVLVHGLGNSLNFWAGVAPRVSEHTRVVALDLPGFGGSRLPRLGFSLESITDDVATFLKRRGVNRCRVVGHSLGAIVAMAIASRRPEMVSRLVLVDGTLISANKSLANAAYAVRHPILALNVAAQFAGGVIPMNEATIGLLLSSGFLRRILLWPFVASPSLVDGELLRVALAGNRGGLGVLRILRAVRETGSLDLMRRVVQPVDLLWGSNDRLIPERDIVWSRATLSVERELVLDNCGHWPLIERPEAVADFLISGMETLR